MAEPSIPAGASTRNSANYLTDTSANDHLVVIKSGGTVWDAYVQQKGSTTGFKDWNEYQTAAAASNPGIANLNNVPAGTTFMQPEQLSNGSITYHYQGGAAINSNAVTGEYHMVVPNADGAGGQTVYSRTSEGNALGGEGYIVKQSSTNAAGATTFDFIGRQAGLTADVRPVSVTEQLNGVETSSFYGSDGALTGRSKTLINADGTLTSDSLANMLQNLRDAAGDLDDMVLDAAELRTLSGSQAQGEAWGGARLLMPSDSTLGDYYRHHEDIQTGAVIPLLLDDQQTQGLGLLDGFDLSNGASVLDGSFESESWNYLNNSAGNASYIDWGYDSSVVDYASYSSNTYSYDATAYSYSSYTYDSYDYSAYNYGSYDYGWSNWWPVALDMDGDGIELVAQENSHAWYDVQGDGYRRNIGWVGSDDALLAIDENHDGKITDARELSFAMWTADTGDTDLQALQTAFDTNHDQKLDAQDARFADLRTWQDKNGDGVSDAGELKTLAEAGIKSISLSVARTDWSSGGNHVAGFATYEKADGTRGWAADVGLGYDTQGWKASVESNLVRMTESGGLVYGIARNSALNLDLGAQGLDGAIGGTGSDTLAAGNKKAVLLEGGAGDDKLTGGAGDDWLAGDAGSDSLSGGDGDDTLVIDAQDAQGNLDGGAGFDMAVVTGVAAVSLDLGATGIEAAVGGAGNDNLRTSGAGRVILAGGAGNDVLTGSVAGDLLYGGTGNDALQGGRGNDVYVFNRGDGADTISDAATTTVTTITTHVEYYPVAVLAGPVVGNAIYQQSLDQAVRILAAEPVGSAAYSQILTMVLGSSRYWQYTTASRTTDTTSTAEVDVDAGQDTLRFGADIGQENLALTTSGTDWVFSIAHNGAATGDQITLKNQTNSKARIEFVEFSDGQKYAMEDLVFGTAGADVLAGTAAANVISGGAGADAMRGGAGNDVYVVDNAGDSVLENANEGTDTVLSSISYSLGANVENLALTGSIALNGTGNALNNTLTGNAGNNVLDGGQGDDVLDGGLGNDVMLGGSGRDLYIVDSVGDVVTETSTLVGEIDTVQAGVSYSLGANVENLVLAGNTALNGSGNALDNVLTGNGGNNALDGGAGNDLLQGDDTGASFGAQLSLSSTYTVNAGWSSSTSYLRELADVNGDGRADIVGFANDGVYVSLAQANLTYTPASRVSTEFGVIGGWTNNDIYLRKAADVNGDGRADIVGFGGSGTYVALANGSGGFDTSRLALNRFGAGEDGGSWKTQTRYARELADVNGDGRADVVGFGGDQVFVSLGNANGTFQQFFSAAYGFSDAGGWTNNDQTPRKLADVNGDGRADIVGFSGDGTYVALANSNGTFGTVYKALAAFGSGPAGGGWTSQTTTPRELADVNGDGRADIVGFGSSGLSVALSLANGYFDTPQLIPGLYTAAQGWTSNDLSPRRLADINGDGRADLVGFSSTEVVGMLSGSSLAYGNDTLDGGAGDDTLNGGSGADTLNGGSGDDRYRFGLGGGRDTIIDISGNDRIVFGAAISAAQITASVANGQVTLFVAPNDSLSFSAPAINNYAVENFEFFDGSVKDTAWLNGLFNVTPTGANKTLLLDEDGSYAITPADFCFSDVNPGDSLSAVRIDSLPGTGSLKLSGTAVTAAQVISAADLAAGRLVFSPAANASGNNYAGLSFSVKDQYGAFGAAPNTLTLNVTAVNDAPALTGAKATLGAGTEDTAYTITQVNLLAGFSDVEGSTLSVVNLSAGNGSFSAFNAATGSWTFTPNANHNGTVNLSYGVSDGTAITAATQSLTLAPVNDAPALAGAKAVLANGIEDTAYTITQAGLLAGFSDADGNTLSVVNLSASNGSLSAFNATTGSWTFTPNANFNGTVNLSYGISDGTATTAGTQSLTLAAVNDAPVLTGAKAALPAGSEDMAYNITQASLLAGFSDVDGNVLSIINLSASNGSLSAFDATTGAWTFTPNANYNGIANLSYGVSDGSTATAAMQSFTLAAVNDAPTLTAFEAPLTTSAEDTEVQVTLAQLQAQGNEADIDGTVNAFVIRAVNTGSLRIGATVAAATAWSTANNTVDATRNAYWTPAANANGVLNAFTAVVKDNGGAESITAVQANVAVAPVNDAPTGAVSISGTPTQNQTLTASHTLADVDGLGAITYQWLAGGAAITGATNASLTLTQAQVGKTISVKASYVDLKGTAESVTSANTAAAANVNDAPTGAINLVRGSALLTATTTIQQGDTLSFTNTLTDVDGLGAMSYQWQGSADSTNWNAINGAATSNFTLTPALAGQSVRVNVRYTDGFGTVEVLNSAPTAPVNLFVGTSGNDALAGTIAADRFVGLAGQDSYTVNHAGDVVMENANEGIDTVNSSVDYSLTANVENLTLTGSGALSGTGNDLANVITGNAAANILAGGAGNDSLDGGAGDDVIEGGTGNDTLTDSVGSNTLRGGQGNDTIKGRGTMEGGQGDDVLIAGDVWSGDTYIFNLGDGKDVITELGLIYNPGYIPDPNWTDTLRFGAGIAASGIGVSRAGNDMVFQVGATDRVTVKDWFVNMSSYLEKLQFADGTVWTLDTLRNMAMSMVGTGNADTINGWDGKDIIDGGAGNDTLNGGAGDDRYFFKLGGGQDRIVDDDLKAGNTDVLSFDAGIANSQLWFNRTGNDLQISVIGTTDKMTVQDWYLGKQYHVEQIKTSDNKVLLDTQVEALVQAMAGFAPPAMGQTTLTAAQQTALAPTLAANWH